MKLFNWIFETKLGHFLFIFIFANLLVMLIVPITCGRVISVTIVALLFSIFDNNRWV